MSRALDDTFLPTKQELEYTDWSLLQRQGLDEIEEDIEEDDKSGEGEFGWQRNCNGL